MNHEADSCIAILHESIGKRQLSADDIPELLEHVRNSKGFISGELALEFIAGQLRISLHDREIWCNTKQFIDTPNRFFEQAP